MSWEGEERRSSNYCAMHEMSMERIKEYDIQIRELEKVADKIKCIDDHEKRLRELESSIKVDQEKFKIVFIKLEELVDKISELTVRFESFIKMVFMLGLSLIGGLLGFFVWYIQNLPR